MLDEDAAWINPDVDFTTTGSYKRVISAGDNWEVVMQPDSGLLGNNFYQSGGTYPQSTVVPAEGEWTHVAMTSVLGTAANPGRRFTSMENSTLRLIMRMMTEPAVRFYSPIDLEGVTTSVIKICWTIS